MKNPVGLTNGIIASRLRLRCPAYLSAGIPAGEGAYPEFPKILLIYNPASGAFFTLSLVIANRVVDRYTSRQVGY
jgi:hypothetical protein